MIPWLQGGVVLMVFLLAAAAFGAEPAHDAALLDRVVAAQQGRSTVQGSLRWLTSRSDDPDTPAREQHVRFFLAFPQRYAVTVTKPGDDEAKTSFISDGTTRWEVTRLFAGEAPDIKAAAVGADDEVEQRLLACFRFDLAALRRDFTIVARAGTDGAVVTLTPSNNQLREQLTVLELTFDAHHRLTTIRSDDPRGNRLVFTVLEAVYDQPLADALFRVAP
jgi:hypothetical protein